MNAEFCWVDEFRGFSITGLCPHLKAVKRSLNKVEFVLVLSAEKLQYNQCVKTKEPVSIKSTGQKKRNQRLRKD